MAKYLPVQIVIYGRNQVDIRKGMKEIHINTFLTHANAAAFARTAGAALGCRVVDQIEESRQAAWERRTETR